MANPQLTIIHKCSTDFSTKSSVQEPWGWKHSARRLMGKPWGFLLNQITKLERENHVTWGKWLIASLVPYIFKLSRKQWNGASYNEIGLWSTLQVLFQFNPDNPWGMYYYYPCFADEEIKV